MRKLRLIKMLSLLLVMAMLLGSVPGVYAASDDTSIDHLIASQEQAVKANEALMQYFYEHGWITEYPDYFSSCFIEDNILHIRLVPPADEEVEALKEVLKDYEEAVCYEYGVYSQSDLQDYADTTAAELMNQGCDVTSWYVDSITGDVVIGVLPESVEQAEELVDRGQTYSYSGEYPSVIIEASGYISNEASNVYGGSQLIIGSAGLSAGTGGYYNGSNALVTCAHGGITVGASVKLGSTTIGTVKKVQYTNNGYGDFSIIQLNSNANVSHRVGNSSRGYTDITNGTYLSPAVGTYIRKYGHISGYAGGRVSYVNLSTKDPSDNTIIKGITQVTLTSGNSAAGDSGGPYLVGNAFCGVHRGSYTEDGTTYIYFTPYTYIKNAGFSAIGSHSCSTWTDTGPANHSGYCTICKETVYEAHSEQWSDSQGKCIRCGRTDPIVVAP